LLDDYESVIHLACTLRAFAAIYKRNPSSILRANMASYPAMQEYGPDDDHLFATILRPAYPFELDLALSVPFRIDLTSSESPPLPAMDRAKAATWWSTIKKFDGKNYKYWVFNMKRQLNRERCKWIVERTELPPAGPIAAAAADLDEDGKPITSTDRTGSAPSQAFTDYNFHVWEALRLVV
jgi:hypothetical protein